MPFTPEELEAMRLADEEIDREFAERYVADQVDKEISRWIDELAYLESLDHKAAAKFKRQKKYGAAYRAEHKEEIAAYQAAYYAEHKEEIAAYKAAYYAEHKEEIAAYNYHKHLPCRKPLQTWRCHFRPRTRHSCPQSLQQYSFLLRSTLLGLNGLGTYHRHQHPHSILLHHRIWHSSLPWLQQVRNDLHSMRLAYFWSATGCRHPQYTR